LAGLAQCAIIPPGGDYVGYISYAKLIERLSAHGVNTYRIKREGVVSQSTYAAIMAGRSGRGTDLTTRSIAVLCGMLKAQPGDLLEYVEEPEPNEPPQEGTCGS
jgi:DNA-binding Xre family transcriptional regulator